MFSAFKDAKTISFPANRFEKVQMAVLLGNLLDQKDNLTLF